MLNVAYRKKKFKRIKILTYFFFYKVKLINKKSKNLKN